MDPNHNYTMAQVMKGMGDVKQPVVNQVVQGGFNIINPEITGDIKQIPHVSDRHRWEVKTENKRRDTQALEYIYDWRNNTPLNNEGKVMPGYYQNKLNASAKSKIRMSNTADAMRVQYAGPDTSEFGLSERITEGLNGIAGLATAKPEKFEAQQNQLAEGTLSFTDLGLGGNHSQVKINSNLGYDVPVETPTYNPFLNGSSGNISKYQESYPDERQTRYGGERNYMTKGDRIMAAVDLAKSQMNIERRQLQEQANHALNGTVRAARTIGSSLDKGINIGSVYNNPTYEQPDAINAMYDEVKQSINPNNRQKVEHFVDRSHDLNRQQDIQQNVQAYYGPGLKQIKHEVANNEIRRKLYDNDEGDKPGLFQAFVEGFKCLFWSDSSDKQVRNRLDVKDKDTRGKIDEYVETLTADPIIKNEVIRFITERHLSEQRGERVYTDDEFVEQILQSPTLQERLKELSKRSRINDDIREIIKDFERLFIANTIETYEMTAKRKKDLTKLYFMNHGIKTEFNPEIIKNEIITEPISVLSLDGETVIRTMLCKNLNGHGGIDYHILQIRKSVGENGNYEYVLSSIGNDEIEHILRKNVNEDIRWNGDIAELSFEDHVKINAAVDEGSVMSMTASKPLHPYQRDILNNNEALKNYCFSNITDDFDDLEERERLQHKHKMTGINVVDGEFRDKQQIQSTTDRKEKYENEGSRINLGTRKKCDMKIHMQKLNAQM